MSCLRPRADSDFACAMLSTFAASERWLPVVRPLVTAQPVADCAPGVAVLVSKAVSDVLQQLRDAIGGAALVVAPVTVATQFQRVTRARRYDTRGERDDWVNSWIRIQESKHTRYLVPTGKQARAVTCAYPPTPLYLHARTHLLYVLVALHCTIRRLTPHYRWSHLSIK